MFLPRVIITGLALLCICGSVTGQPSTPDFGDIPQKHIELNSFKGDSSLGAIILFDRGKVSFSPDLELEFERHRRIKILSKKGFDWADVTIPYYAEGRRQEINNLDAVSYNVMPNGEVKSRKVGRRNFFEEKVSDKWEQVKFTFPAVEPGTIIEYKYRMESESLLDFPDWTFQHDIPTLTSLYTAKVPEWYRYMYYFQGIEQLDKQDQETYRDSKYIQFNRNSARRSRGGFIDYKVTEYLWQMNNIPALTEEPFMSSVKNFRSKLYVQLASINYPNTPVKPIMNNWNQVVEELNGHEKFGKRLESSSLLKEVTARVTEEDSSAFDRMKSIYEYISKSIKWNEDLKLLADKSLEDVLAQNSGSSVEINLLLLQMLREAGIEAYPVLMSTRDNGKLQTVYPVMAQFNHVICAAKVDEKTHYLDAKSELRPYNLLPVADLNGDALLVKNDGYKWANITSTAPSSEFFMLNIKMNEDASIDGALETRLSGYPALEARVALDNKKEKSDGDVLKERWFDNYPDIQLEKVSVKNKKNSDENLSATARLSNLKASNSSNNDYYYFNPMVVLREKSNPFKLKGRNFPVVFPSTFSKKMIVNISLPDGMIVEEIPKSRIVRLDKQAGFYKRLIQKTPVNGNLTMLYEINFNRHIFKPAEYQQLKKFWEELVNTHSEVVVLKRKEMKKNENVSTNE